MNIDKYYQKANQYIKNNQIEEALTTFISGVEKGCAKCAFGILQTTITYGSTTMTEEEAISIFRSCFDRIKCLAEMGDDEAMVIVAESIRDGFVEDGNEPALLWLKKAADLGNQAAQKLIAEWNAELLPLPSPEGSDLQDLLPVGRTRELMGRYLGSVDHQWNQTDDSEEPEERGLVAITPRSDAPSEVLQDTALIADPDIDILEEYGIIDAMRKKQREDMQKEI